jgi:hypothetical protein
VLVEDSFAGPPDSGYRGDRDGGALGKTFIDGGWGVFLSEVVGEVMVFPDHLQLDAGEAGDFAGEVEDVLAGGGDHVGLAMSETERVLLGLSGQCGGAEGEGGEEKFAPVHDVTLHRLREDWK